MLVDIIPASDKMCEELASVKRQVWETTYRGIYPNDKFDNFNIENEYKKFLHMINSNTVELFVAKLNNKIIGYMAIGKSTRRLNAENDEIVLLYILKEFQGLGIGKLLFNFAKEKLKVASPKQFVVYCNKYNDNAINFYTKMGCKICGIDADNEDRSLPQVKFLFKF